MRYYETANEEVAARLFHAPVPDEPDIDAMESACSGGIFIGFTGLLSVPFFINFDYLINQHVFIFGMSGGGKTFLMKNMMLRLHYMLECSVLLVDFTGEYAEFARFAGCRETGPSVKMQLKQGITYIDLKGYSEAEKVQHAESVLRAVAEVMRSGASRRRLFVIMDEAWKMLGRSAPLNAIVREGRKYSVGLVFASQLVEDAELEAIANVATLFIFRMQNRGSLEKIARNYNIGEEALLRIQNLDVGSCYVVQIRKSAAREAFVLKRVIGIGLKRRIRLDFGGNMVEIEEKRLEAVISGLCKDDTSAFISEIKRSGSVELHSLIYGLMRRGADRRAILRSLEGFGIGDIELSDAFSMAVGGMDEASK